MSREAMKLALEARIAQLEAELMRMQGRELKLQFALAEQPAQQEPVAWMDGPHLVMRSDWRERANYKGPWVDFGRAIPDSWAPVLYTSPPAQRKQVGDSRFESWCSEDFDPKGKGTKQQMREAYEAGMNDTSPQAQRKPLTPDMFWDQDDAETPYDSIEELLNHEICNGYLEVGAVFTLLQAKKFPSVKIRVTSIDENECEAEYEIIEAAHGIKENT